jgi:hypothetical protein
MTALVATETININENVSKMLKDLLTDPDMADRLNNPFYEEHTNVPNFCRGALWNILMLLDSTKPFVCEPMRKAIISWLEQRRNYDEPTVWRDAKTKMTLMRSMNGIEFDYYAMRPAHVWAGFFLSGTDRYADYKALDPWWNQRWKDPSYASPAGLMDREGQHTMVAENAAAAVVSAVALVGLFSFQPVTVVIAFGTGLRAIMLWLAGGSPAAIMTLLGLRVVEEILLTSDSNLIRAGGAYPSYKREWFRLYIPQITPAVTKKAVSP